jgi:RNA polymerase sigma factor (sigma-70 family)
MRSKQLNDQQIVAGILSGDERSLRSFYRQYHQSITSYIKMKIQNEADAEEVIQDTLLATIEAMRDFSFRSSLFTFMCSIANHKVIDFYRRKKIKHMVFSAMPDIEALLVSLISPENILDEEILRDKINKTFDLIAPMYKKILQLKYIYGYSVDEIAEKLSISFKSAESQLFRARKAFTTAYATA